MAHLRSILMFTSIHVRQWCSTSIIQSLAVELDTCRPTEAPIKHASMKIDINITSYIRVYIVTLNCARFFLYVIVIQKCNECDGGYIAITKRSESIFRSFWFDSCIASIHGTSAELYGVYGRTGVHVSCCAVYVEESNAVIKRVTNQRLLAIHYSLEI
jgi:hypothetical protein